MKSESEKLKNVLDVLCEIDESACSALLPKVTHAQAKQKLREILSYARSAIAESNDCQSSGYSHD